MLIWFFVGPAAGKFYSDRSGSSSFGALLVYIEKSLMDHLLMAARHHSRADLEIQT